MFESIYLRCRTSLMLGLLAVSLPLWLAGCGKEEPSDGHDAHTHTALESTATRPSTESSANQVDDYPLTTCVVSGDPLDAMGEAFVIEHVGREVRFCCRSCVTEFNEDPAKYLAMLDQAANSGHGAKTNGIDKQEAGHHDHEGHHH
jgi:YHS domain-containing protein